MISSPLSAREIPRLHSLDSMRGIACLIVLIGHTIGAFDWDTSIYGVFLINNIVDGRSAVTFFFVLSGFVLTLGCFGQDRKPFYLVPFFIRRFTRIWIPWFAIFLISLIAKEYWWTPVPEGVSLSKHQEVFWSKDCTAIDFLRQAIFILKDHAKVIIPQDWSLRVELRAAIIIPLMILAIRANKIILVLLALGLVIAIPRTGHYYVSFVIGTFVAYCYSGAKERRSEGAKERRSEGAKERRSEGAKEALGWP